jgi:hypothetical protein
MYALFSIVRNLNYILHTLDHKAAQILSPPSAIPCKELNHSPATAVSEDCVGIVSEGGSFCASFFCIIVRGCSVFPLFLCFNFSACEQQILRQDLELSPVSAISLASAHLPPPAAF